jgi:phosphatidylglycerophosphate synthase
MSTVGSASRHAQRTPLPYQPAWRRPIANVFRSTANAAVRFCVRRHVHPDVISYLSIVASAIAAVLFWRSSSSSWLLFAAPAFCYVRLWFNMLDGMVAIAAKKATARGEILNDLPDRISDVLIFAGVAHSGLGTSYLGYWTAIFALLTAYVGTLGQAVGVQREFSGVMAKPWRMVVLHAGAWCVLATGRPEIIDWTCIVIIAGCIQTIAVRLRRILNALQAKAEGVTE